jgi:hypothetical protein
MRVASKHSCQSSVHCVPVSITSSHSFPSNLHQLLPLSGMSVDPQDISDARRMHI